MAVSIVTAIAATASGVATGAVAMTLSAIAINFGINLALGVALNALTPKQSTKPRGYRVTQKGSALDQQIIYGEVRSAGVVVYDETTGKKNKFLHRVIVFAGHEVDSFVKLHINGEDIDLIGTKVYGVDVSENLYNGGSRVTRIQVEVPDTATEIVGDNWGPSEYDLFELFKSSDISGADTFVNQTQYNGAEVMTLTSGITGVAADDKFKGKIRIYTHEGADDQVADAELVAASSKWTSQHRLRGLAYIYVRMEFNADVFPNGIPEITATIRGKKVYDPETDTVAWSDNPALCLRDYLTSTTYGLGESEDSIDDDLVIAAKTVCNSTDTISGEKRYTCNGDFVTTITPKDLIQNLLTSMGGLLSYSQGKWRMLAAQWYEPELTLTVDDLRSPIALSTRVSGRDNFNIVRGVYRGEETNWQPTDYTEVRSAAYIAADAGEESPKDLDLPFTSSMDEARRIALIFLERNRQQLSLSATFGLRAAQLKIGDNVRFDVERFGWGDSLVKYFEVTKWRMYVSDDLTIRVDMTLRETAESVFDEVDDGAVYERDNTSLLSPFTVPAVGISSETQTRILNEKLTNVIVVTITSDEDSYVDYVDVEFRKSEDTEFSSLGSGNLGAYEAVDLDNGLYDFRARAVNTFGVKSKWTYHTRIEALGDLTTPDTVTDFTATISDSTLHLEWEPVSNPDLSYYRIRHAVETVGATWANASTAINKVSRPATSASLPARPGTYMIRAYDKSGLLSEASSAVVVVADQLYDYGNTLSLTDSPTFSGSKTDCSVDSSLLRITDPSVAPSVAEYEFSTYIDTGSVRRAYCWVSAAVQRLDDSGGLFDDIPGLFDSLPGLFDDLSGTSQYADTNIVVYVSSTPDDPSGSPVWSAWQRIQAGELYGRAFKFKVVLSSETNDATPAISALTAYVEYD